jgi:FKBP-type peptidyl-prolyl cis-trans isomerase SlpA
VIGRVAAGGDTLSLRYALRLRDGTEILSNFDDAAPDLLTLGDGTLATTLERWLIGLAVGERHVFLLDAKQAFGLSQPDLIHTLRPAEVATDKPLQVGSVVEFTLADGQTLAGQILEIGQETIQVDFNHPLADLPIEFEVEIVQLHEASFPERKSI